MEKLVSAVQVINFDVNASLITVQIGKELTKKGKKINLVDIFIASIAIANDLTIATLDKDFNKIDKLKTLIF